MLGKWLGLTPTIAGVIVGMYLIIGVIEFFIPAEKGQTWAGRYRNFTYTLIYLALGKLLLDALLRYLPAWAPPVHHRDYPALFALVYLVVHDFFYYWYHRVEHRWSILWRIHELHHSDSEVNITTSLRTHWIEIPIQYCVVTVPTLLIVGIDLQAIFWWLIFGQMWEMFAHANVNCFVNPAAAVLCNPSIHRIHHSRLEEHHYCNFAQVLTLYDMVFGTYIAPQRGAMPPTGTKAIPSDYSILMNVVRPFLRQKQPGPGRRWAHQRPFNRLRQQQTTNR
jgi:sterol desaturase/sphingolipid hydroxylase (fatty acid hydroxylase superfamily)